MFYGRTKNPAWSESELDVWVNPKHRCSLNVMGLINLPDMVSTGFPKLFGQITCPDLFMSADQGLRSVSGEKDIARIKELLPQLQIIHVPGAGHSIRRDQFASHMEVVEQFLAGLQRFG